MTGRLVALDLPGGPGFVDALRRVWDAGDAAFPVDRRLPAPARDAVLAAMAPAAVVGPDGRELPRAGGRPVGADDALVVATSGSTGQPKGVVLTHGALAASAHATHARLGVDDRDHWLACLPLAHVGGLAVVTRALITGTRLTVHDGFDAARVDASGATLVALVATAVPRIDPTRFRVLLLGGSSRPDEIPPNAVFTYGMTETGSGVVYDGRPLDGVEVRIDDDGQILLRAPMLLRAYRDGHDPRDADGWFPTGDLGHWRPDGLLHVEGRAGDVIVTGGEKVWPEPVERVLAGVPGVAEVVVAGTVDDEWGQAVTAFVVPRDATRPPTLAALRAAAKERLAPYAAPRRVQLVTAIPRTGLGKPRRHELAAGWDLTSGDEH